MSLRKKILFPILLLSLAVLGTSGYFLLVKNAEVLRNQLIQKGRTLALALAEGSTGGKDQIDEATASSLVQSYVAGREETGILYALVISRKSVTPILAPQNEVLPTDSEEKVESPSREVQDKAMVDPKFSNGHQCQAAIFDNRNNYIGIARVGLSFAPVDLEQRKLLISFAVLATLVLISSFAISNYLSKSMSEPMDDMLAGLDAMGRGDLSHRLEIKNDDEVGQLNASFNQMADRLRISRTKIENYSRDLEEMVRARTGELRRAYEELKRLDELKDSFLSSVSHELRTPLTSIHSFAEILMQYADEDPATRKEFLEIIKRETERLSRLIDDVLDLAKIEAGMATWKPERYDLRGIIQDSIAAIRPLMDTSKITVQFTPPPRVPQVLADRDRISQVITNLLSNARKFTHANDTIDVRMSIDSGYLRVEVEDHGIGISPENLDKVFEKFRQIESAGHLTTKVKGTGLGLPISRDIIEFHGGKMWCESKLGEGTTFIFTIPTADNPEPRPICDHVEAAL